jgi:hypothetical protein
MVYGSGPYILLSQDPTQIVMIAYRDGATYRGITTIYSSSPLPIRPVGGTSGISGRKVVFTQNLRNYATSPGIISFTWGYEIQRWTGAAWVPLMQGVSPTFTSFVISPLASRNVYWYVTLPSDVVWCNLIRVHEDFRWNIIWPWQANGFYYEGASWCTNRFSTSPHVHPGDITGAATTFPYLGADHICNIKDATPIGIYWMQTVPPPPTTDQTSIFARADINGDGIVNIKDATPVGIYWMQTW